MKANDPTQAHADAPSGVLTAEDTARFLRRMEQAERELARAQRILRAVGRCSDAGASETDEAAFLTRVCRTIVEQGGYRMVWVGFAENDAAKTVRPVAFAGEEEGYLKAIRVTWDESVLGRGPMGTAIRLGQASVMGAIPAATPFEPWRAEAVVRGYQSAIGVPLVIGARAVGAVGIYSGGEAFDEDEVEMLTVLGKVISGGLATIRSP